MTPELLVLFISLVAVGEAWIIVKQHQKIGSLQNLIKKAGDILKPDKPKKPEPPKPKRPWYKVNIHE